MLEMASLGAKVMQARSIEFAMKYGVRIHVRSSFSEEEGTWIVPEEEVMEKVEVRAITLDTNESRFTVVRVPDRPGIAYSLFKALWGCSHSGGYDRSERVPSRLHGSVLYGKQG